MYAVGIGNSPNPKQEVTVVTTTYTRRIRVFGRWITIYRRTRTVRSTYQAVSA